MPSLADVFRSLSMMREDGVFSGYAIGGATAVLFYAEPTRTYDVDVFVSSTRTGDLAPLSAIYEWAARAGFPSTGEHVMIHGVPVQFLPAHNRLVADAVASARAIDYEGVVVPVIDPEHLVALALQAGGARRRERAWQLLETGRVDRERLRVLLDRHGIDARIPDDV